MAISFTPYLKLIVDSNLTANAKANLNRIDGLGLVFQQDAAGNTLFRSIEDIYILPNNSAVGGTGSGGSLFFGSVDQPLDSANFYVDAFSLSGSVSLLDQGTGGNKYLNIKYNSTLSGPVDTSADRTLSVDLEGANRQLVLGVNMSVAANTLTLGALSYTLPATSAALVDTASAQTLTNKTISGATNTLSNIAYSSLLLTNNITNTDIASTASISYSKLNLVASLVNADISPTAAIAYSKLNLASSLVDSDVAGGAAIAGTKISPDFGNQAIRTSGSVNVAVDASVATSFVANPSQVSNIVLTLPATAPLLNEVLAYNGSTLDWVPAGSGTVTSVGASLSTELDAILDLSGSPITISGTLSFDLATQTANTILAGPSTGSPAKPAFRALVVDDIPTLTTSKISDYNTAWDARLATKSTTDLAEGTNLYYTTARFDTRFSSKSTTDLTEGTNLYYTNARADARIDLRKYSTIWASGDGTTKAITHSLGTTEVSWNIFDIDSGEEVWPDTATRTSTSAMTFTSTQAPTGSGWRIIVRS